jgi:hypothetical protein
VVPWASGPVFLFCAPKLVFGGTKGLGSRFHVLHARTHFPPYRGRRVPFSCFELPDSFSAVPGASGPVFMLCASIIVFGGAECVVSRFHVLRSRTNFRRNRGRPVRFSCFARSDSFSVVPRASGPFSCFVLLDTFSAVSGASGLVFLFCAPGLVFGGTEGVGSRFHVLRSRTRFRRYRGRRVPFS